MTAEELISTPVGARASDSVLLVESTLFACIPACWGATAVGEEDVVGLSLADVPDALAESPEPLGAAAEDCEESAADESELLAVSPVPRLAGCGATVAGAALWALPSGGRTGDLGGGRIR